MIDLEITKLHLRIDYEDEDSYLNLLILAATDHVKNITGIENDATAPITYDLACLLLIAHWFGNREATSETNLYKIPFGVSNLIQNLRQGGDFI